MCGICICVPQYTVRASCFCLLTWLIGFSVKLGWRFFVYLFRDGMYVWMEKRGKGREMLADRLRLDLCKRGACKLRVDHPDETHGQCVRVNS